MNRTFRTIVAIALAASLAMSVGCSASVSTESRAQVEVCGDLVVGILTGDGELLKGAVPAATLEEQPDVFADVVGILDDPVDVDREWVDDVLILTVPSSSERYRLWVDTDADTPTVLGELAGEQTSFSLVEEDDGWRVDTMDDMAVGDLLTALTMVPQSDEELQAFNERIDCFTNQAILESAAEIYFEVEGSMPASMDDLVPDWLDEVYFCPDAASGYSEQNSADGYFSGMGPDGVLEPCTVHGHHTEAEDF